MAINSWAEVYDDASLDQIVEPSARPIVARIAKNCLYNPSQILGHGAAPYLFDRIEARFAGEDPTSTCEN